MVALHLFAIGALSLGKACELAGISRWEFFELNQKAQIVLHYSREDLETDIENLKGIKP